MRHTTAFAIVLIAVNLYAVRCAAQTAYRCGSSYSQQPCLGGVAVQADDARTAQQAAQAAAAAKRDSRLADEMQRDRLRQEAKAAPANIPAPKAQPDNVTLHPHMPMANVPKKPKLEPRPFKASGPQASKTATVGAKPDAKDPKGKSDIAAESRPRVQASGGKPAKEKSGKAS